MRASINSMDSETAAQQLVGAVFNGRWRLIKLVGEGGMGAVYEAHGLRNDGVRAIKVLHPEFIGEDNILQRFFAEAQAVRQLQHPNITQIYDHGRAEDGTPYLVMEFLQGHPLSSYMQPGRPMPPSQAAGIILGVLQALTVAHQRNVVHRDLKPDNLFLVPDGRGNHVVKVLDFGIAKVMDAAGGMGSKTKTGVLLGTPGYMSPEQIKNSKGVDPRSDLWSTGVIFYEMMTGREAFPAENEFTRLTLVLTQEIRPVAEVAPHLVPWSSFFQRALSKDMKGRFQSASEMAQAVAAMMAGSSSAQGKDGGTVAISMPLPGSMGHGQSYPNTSASPAAQRYPNPPPPNQHGANPQAMGGRPSPNQLPTAQVQTPYSQQQYSAPQHGGGQRISAVPPPMSNQYPNVPHGGPQSYVAAGSVPPPSNLPAQNQNPPTHVSAHRPPGVPTLTQGSRSSPSVEVLAPPPVGVPWWVVGAVAGACLILGFIVGYAVK